MGPNIILPIMENNLIILRYLKLLPSTAIHVYLDPITNFRCSLSIVWKIVLIKGCECSLTNTHISIPFGGISYCPCSTVIFFCFSRSSVLLSAATFEAMHTEFCRSLMCVQQIWWLSSYWLGVGRRNGWWLLYFGRPPEAAGNSPGTNDERHHVLRWTRLLVQARQRPRSRLQSLLLRRTGEALDRTREDEQILSRIR